MRLSRVLRLTLAPLALAACARASTVGSGPRFATGEALLAGMRAEYGDWYRSLTFVQRTVQTPAGGGAERRSTWYEAMQLPGRLRIDIDLAQNSGQLFARDSQFVFVGGRQRAAAAGYNPLLVLGFDVYAQSPARTAAALRTLGFPLGPVRSGTWQERPVWIVGGRDATDVHSHQFWVDQERLVFVRMLQPFPGDTSKTFEVRFNKYQPLAGGWIAPQVEGFVDGKRILLEEYEQIRANPRLDAALFDPKQWTTAKHWAR